MRRDKEDGVPVPVLRWQSEQQRDDRASQPWQRVRQLVLLRMAKSAMQRENICTHARGAKRPCGQPARRGESACSITHQRDARAHRRAGRARKRKKHRLGHAAGPPRAAREMTMESMTMKQLFAPWELAAWTVRPCLCRSASASVLVLWSRGAFSSASLLSNLPEMTSHMAAVMF